MTLMALATESIYIDPGEKVYTTCCPGTGDHNGCTLFTHVKDGHITKVERAIYPNGEEGIICLRGFASANLFDHPDRLTKPLKRKGERGAGKWEEISWEQALDEVAVEISGLANNFGPQSLVILSSGSSHAPFSSIHSHIGARFANLFGATDYLIGIPMDNNAIAANHYDFGSGIEDIETDSADLVHSKYIVIWGANYAESSPKDMKGVIEAKVRGAKLVDVGVIFDQTAGCCDEFVAVKPGSDAALTLSLAQVIVNENLHDEAFLRDHTVAPFLVRQDTGMFLRASDVFEGGDSTNYIVWNTQANAPETLAPDTFHFDYSPAVTGIYDVAGITCEPSFQLLVEKLEKYAPEQTAQLTGVPAEKCRQLAREMATIKPMTIAINFGLRYWQACQAHRGINLLAALTGNIGVPGGGVFLPKVISPPVFNVPAIINSTNSISSTLRWDMAMKAMETGQPYPIRGMFIVGNNILNCAPNRNDWLNKRLPNLDLIIVNDIFMTDTARYADYVLPDATVFERNDIDFQHGCVVLQQKAVEPKDGVLNRVQMWSELAKRMGLGEYFDKNEEEWIDIMLLSGHPWVDGITVAELKENGGLVPARVPVQQPKAFSEEKFKTTSGRFEFYSENLVENDTAMPTYKPSLESSHTGPGKKYPLSFLSRRKRFRTQSLFAKDADMLALQPEPALDINPVDAKARGIHNGDLVRIYNDRGQLRVHARLTEIVPPGTCNFDNGWYGEQMEGGHYEELVLDAGCDITFSQTHEIWWNRIIKSHSWWELFFAGRPDTIWDCAVQVEKV